MNHNLMKVFEWTRATGQWVFRSSVLEVYIWVLIYPLPLLIIWTSTWGDSLVDEIECPSLMVVSHSILDLQEEDSLSTVDKMGVLYSCMHQAMTFDLAK